MKTFISWNVAQQTSFISLPILSLFCNLLDSILTFILCLVSAISFPLKLTRWFLFFLCKQGWFVQWPTALCSLGEKHCRFFLMLFIFYSFFCWMINISIILPLWSLFMLSPFLFICCSVVCVFTVRSSCS